MLSRALEDRYKKETSARSALQSQHHTAMSHFPATIKAITFSKTGDVDVIEKTEKPFPQRGPGDIILKVRAWIRRPPALMLNHLSRSFVTVGVGRVCRR